MASEKKELDLIDIIKEFFAWIGKMLKGIGIGILEFIRFSFQQIWILIIFLILGVAVAVLMFFTTKTYESNLILRLNVSDSHVFYELTKSLDARIVSDQSLAERLNISDSVADNIVSIKPHFIIDENNNGTADWIDVRGNFVETRNSVRMRDQLSITVRSKDLYSFPVIQEGLIYFYSNNELFIAEKELRARQQRQTLEFIQREINRLDSLSNFKYFRNPINRTLTVDSETITFGERPKQLFHTDIADLRTQKDSIQKVSEIHNTIVTVIKPFTVSRTPVNGLFKLLVIYCFIFLSLGYIFALYLKYRNQIWKFLNEKK